MQLIPSIAFKELTTKSLLSWNASDLIGINSCVPFKASTAAAWLIDDGFVVDWDWIFAIAFITSLSPAA